MFWSGWGVYIIVVDCFLREYANCDTVLFFQPKKEETEAGIPCWIRSVSSVLNIDTFTSFQQINREVEKLKLYVYIYVLEYFHDFQPVENSG